MPSSAPWCRHFQAVEFAGDRRDAHVSVGADVVDDVGKGSGEGIGLCPVLLRSDGSHGAELRPSGLCGCEGLFRALADLVAFPFGHRSHDVNHHLVRLRHIAAEELDTALEKVRDDRDASGQPVELGDEEHGLIALAVGQGAFEFGPVLALGALDFLIRGDERSARLGCVSEHGPLLRFETQPGTPLFVRGNAVVRHKLLHASVESGISEVRSYIPLFPK